MFVQFYPLHPIQSCNCSRDKMSLPKKMSFLPPIRTCTCPENNFKLKHRGCFKHGVPDETLTMPRYCLPRCPCKQTEHYEETEEVVVRSSPLGQPLSAEVMLGKATCSICGGSDLPRGVYSRALNETHCEYCHMTYEGYPMILWFSFHKIK